MIGLLDQHRFLRAGMVRFALFRQTLVRLVLGAVLTLGLVACEESKSEQQAPSAAVSSQAGPPLGPPPERPAPRVGMAWIPGGALVAGTPVDRLPRVPDEEMPGEQVMLDGFYIDRFPYPNEEGAIPVTNVTQQEARGLCAEKGKRLCSELEWERACKGPDNYTYEYGDRYQPEICGTGRAAQLMPSGVRVGCRSPFDVADLHGGAFEWTDSPWGRGDEEERVTLRGGNGRDGQLVGRCANARSSAPDEKSGTIGFRCCQGSRNPVEVNLRVTVPPGLVPRARFEEPLEGRLLAAIPEEDRKELARGGRIRRERAWLWRPVGNEEIHALAVCGRGKVPATAFPPRCGLLLARVNLGKIDVVGFGSTGQWVPNLYRRHGVRALWLIGGDKMGSFKRALTYHWGEVEVGDVSRGVPKAPK